MTTGLKKVKSQFKTGQLMLYRGIMAVCSEIHTKHINTLCGQNVELLNVKLTVHIVTLCKKTTFLILLDPHNVNKKISLAFESTALPDNVGQ